MICMLCCPHRLAPGIVLLLLAACSNEIENGTRTSSAKNSTATALFRDVAHESGLDFRHFNGMSGKLYYAEMIGSGAALFDYDNDGDLDVYLVQGEMLGPHGYDDATFPPSDSPPLYDRLYRNDLITGSNGTPKLKFTDVTEEAGIYVKDYGMGVAAGDFNNDGWIDLYVTGFGHNHLLRNRGDGSFEDVTVQAGVDDKHWSTSALFTDVDADGWLDLFVCNYVDYSIENSKPCYDSNSELNYCGPTSYEPEPDRLFRNNGGNDFTEISSESGIAAEYGACLGAVQADFNGDGRQDLYVANDGAANQLWLNQGRGRFRNDALFAGAAFNASGRPEASMGVDAADFDNDGDEDLIVAHLRSETNTVYRNDGKGIFLDVSSVTGLGMPSRSFTAFGTAWIDFDNDGWLDLFMANGEVRTIEALARKKDPYPLHQRNQLFRNLGTGRFEEVSSTAGSVFQLSEVSRGAAFGDIDNDGDVDLLVTNNAGPARLLLNESGSGNHWIGVRLIDAETGRDAIGARLELLQSPHAPIWRRVRVAASYLSANDPRILVGLGVREGPVSLRIHWPNGATDRHDGLEVNKYYAFSSGPSK